VLIVSVGACAGLGSSSDDGDPRTLRIAHNSNAAALPVQVALTEGIFADHDLRVEFTKVENISTLPGALGASFDIALSASTTVIAAAQQGIPVTQVSGATINVKDNPSGFVVGARSSGVTDIKHLAGKTIGVLTETGTAHLATRAWLRAEGVDPEGVRAVQVDGPVQADQFVAGHVDAVETVMPFSSQVMRNPDAANLGDPYVRLAPELSAVVWIARQDFATENADVLADFRRALDTAQEFIAGDEEKAWQVLEQYTGLPSSAMRSAKLPTYTTEIRRQDLAIWLRTMRDVNGFSGDDVDLDALVASRS
jgi:ABC-type nitrate/sulfonate/bicarbonate transport system substrate-binding protein